MKLILSMIFNVPILWHRFPSNPGRQVQLNDFPFSEHIPPCRHGAEEHGEPPEGQCSLFYAEFLYIHVKISMLTCRLSRLYNASLFK